MRSISLFFLCMIPLLSGCPSVYYAKTQMPVQTEQDIAKIKNPATVKIEREDNPWGGATPFVVYDGQKEIGRLGPTGAFEWKREAGYLKLTIKGVPKAIASNAVPDEVTYEDFIQAGDTYGFMSNIVFPDDKWAISIKPQQEQASEDIIAFGRAEYWNTIGSYEGFITSHAKSPNIDEAIRRYENLIEEAGILNIDNLNKKNVEILKAYLKALPNGKHAQFAEEVNQYHEAETKPSKEAFEDYLEKWPDGKFEKWAKDNLASTSLGEVKDQLLVEALAKTNRALLDEFMKIVAKCEKDYAGTVTEIRLLDRHTCMHIIRDSLVVLDGSFNLNLTSRHRRFQAEYYYYNGEVSVGNLKFTLRGGVLSIPKFDKDLEIVSGFTEDSSVIRDGKQYHYNGSHWVHGMDNPFFPVEK